MGNLNVSGIIFRLGKENIESIHIHEDKVCQAYSQAVQPRDKAHFCHVLRGKSGEIHFWDTLKQNWLDIHWEKPWAFLVEQPTNLVCNWSAIYVIVYVHSPKEKFVVDFFFNQNKCLAPQKHKHIFNLHCKFDSECKMFL